MARPRHFQVNIDGETVTIVPRTTSKEIHGLAGASGAERRQAHPRGGLVQWHPGREQAIRP